MRILLSPIFTEDAISYSFETNKITALINGESDTFDFSAMSDGVLDEIVTTLPYSPIISAEKENGVLSVVLLNPIGEDATEEEKFPEWIEV